MLMTERIDLKRSVSPSFSFDIVRRGNRKRFIYSASSPDKHHTIVQTRKFDLYGDTSNW